MVSLGRLELPRSFEHQNLNLARLPITPQGHFKNIWMRDWSARRISKPRPSPCKGDALPLSYERILLTQTVTFHTTCLQCIKSYITIRLIFKIRRFLRTYCTYRLYLQETLADPGSLGSICAAPATSLCSMRFFKEVSEVSNSSRFLTRRRIPSWIRPTGFASFRIFNISFLVGDLPDSKKVS